MSVVIPMLNERGYILLCLQAFEQQSYPTDRLDVIVVDGGSTDGSRQEVLEFSASRPWVRLVDNPARKAAAAFNVGVEAALGDVLILFSAHGEPSPEFVERSVRVLQETGVAGVGGRYLHEGTDPTSAAIGLAMVSPFGMASPHRSMRHRGEVDTISHPAYDIAALRAVGPFDESLERNSDYELNYRMRQAGHRLLFDPTVVSTYRPRASLSRLGRQFWWYGRWKERVVRQHPGSLRLRHLVPPFVVLGLAAVPITTRWRRGRRLALGGAAAYALAVGTATAAARPVAHEANPLAVAASFPVMHFAWGAGFLTSAAEDIMSPRDQG